MKCTYAEFLERKTSIGSSSGFEPVFLPDSLFAFQRALAEWVIRKGRGAIFADCGLGKTLIELVWAENIVRDTNGRVLILLPLAVAPQHIREAEKFGIEAKRSFNGELHPGINVTNYDRLHHFNPNDFEAVACDESSILKHAGGATQKQVT